MSEKELLPVPEASEPESAHRPGDGSKPPEELSQIEALELEERLRYLGYIE